MTNSVTGAEIPPGSGEEKFDASAVQSRLKTRWLGRRIYFRPTVSSTNSLLAERAAQGAPHGAVYLTDYQRSGKGRRNRTWEAPRGTSLLFSLLLQPRWPDAQATWLTMIAGLATVSAIEGVASLQTALKWPNDIMLEVDGSWRKAGGILLETQMRSGALQQAIVGVGLNVNIPPGELPEAAAPATSLLAVAGRPYSRAALLVALLAEMERLYEAAERGQSPHAAWNERLLARGRTVQVRSGTETVTGIAEGSDRWGRLLVRDSGGKRHAFAAGDVTLRPDA